MLEGRASVERADASAAVKWFVAGRGADNASRLRASCSSGKLELFAPALIYYEVANALRLHPYYRLTETGMLDAIAALKGYANSQEPTTEVWLRAFKIPTSEGVAVYDALYIATSLVLDAKLVTSDEGSTEKLNEDVRRRITLLSELSV